MLIDEIAEIIEKCIIIKITQPSIDRNKGNIYDTTRMHWVMSIKRASTADYVLSVQSGIVLEVYTDMVWETHESGRIIFVGKQAENSIRDKYVGKRIPQQFMKVGSANPCQYVNC